MNSVHPFSSILRLILLAGLCAGLATLASARSTLDSQVEPLIGDINGDGYVDEKDLFILLRLWGPSADLNCDGRVDGQDLLILLQNWGPNPEKGDLNNDGVVDVKDLRILLSQWGRHGADLNCDGVVDVQDLLILLANWTGGPERPTPERPTTDTRPDVRPERPVYERPEVNVRPRG